MRIWSIHPQFLDSKGLVALWREGLLAKHVLEGKTNGYRNHPQLYRFRQQPDPVNSICHYLKAVLAEAGVRGYNFDASKIYNKKDTGVEKIPVTKGQVEFETRHLLCKLKSRDPGRYTLLERINALETHPLFIMVEGKIEKWEKV
jgi:hypothetical protein